MVVPPPKKAKIRPKIVDCIFISYAHNSNAYRFLVHESNIPNIHKNKIMKQGMHHYSKMYLHVNPRRIQVHQNVSWRQLVKIVKIKIKIVRLNLSIVKEQG